MTLRWRRIRGRGPSTLSLVVRGETLGSPVELMLPHCRRLDIGLCLPPALGVVQSRNLPVVDLPLVRAIGNAASAAALLGFGGFTLLNLLAELAARVQPVHRTPTDHELLTNEIQRAFAEMRDEGMVFLPLGPEMERIDGGAIVLQSLRRTRCIDLHPLLFAHEDVRSLQPFRLEGGRNVYALPFRRPERADNLDTVSSIRCDGLTFIDAHHAPNTAVGRAAVELLAGEDLSFYYTEPSRRRWWRPWRPAASEHAVTEPGAGDRQMAGIAGSVWFVVGSAMLVTTGQPILVLAGIILAASVVFGLWRESALEVPPTYGVHLWLWGAELCGRIIAWWLVIFMLLLPATLLSGSFHVLVWFAGSLYLLGRLASRAGALSALGTAHLLHSALGILLFSLTGSPLPLLASLFLVAMLVPMAAGKPPARSGPPRGWPFRRDAHSPEAVDGRDSLALTFSLAAWVACHLDGACAESPPQLRELLARPVGEARLRLARRILAHAVQFQEGPFLRELAQNALDEAARVHAPRWRRLLNIECRQLGDDLIEIYVTDLLGMSFSTVVNELLVPNRSSKSGRDWGVIGRFGQGFFTTLREAECVDVRSHSSAARDAWHVDLRLVPISEDGRLHDVTVILTARRGTDRHQGATTIGWRGRKRGTGNLEESAVRAARETLRHVAAENLYVVVNGERANKPASNYARVPTTLGPLRIYVEDDTHRDVAVTQNGLIVTRVSRNDLQRFFPGAPGEWVDFLFAGGVVIDLPPGLPLTRTRNAIAAGKRFVVGLRRELVRACLLADVEFALRRMPWPSSLQRRALPEDVDDWHHSRSSWKQRLWASMWPSAELVSPAAQVADGRPTDPECSGRTRAELLLDLPCVRYGWRGRRSLSELRPLTWQALLRCQLPMLSSPRQLIALPVSGVQRRRKWERRGTLGTLVRWVGLGFILSLALGVLVGGVVVLSLPFAFIGVNVGLMAAVAAALVYLAYVGYAIVRRIGPNLATAIANTVAAGRQSVWDALGTIASRVIAQLFADADRRDQGGPSMRVYHRPSRALAFVEQGSGLTGDINWNGARMHGAWDLRYLRSYLRAADEAEAAHRLLPWLTRFIDVVTHESVHLLEEAQATTHDEAFERRQRRLIDRVLRHEREVMDLFIEQRRRHVRWTWMPAWLFIPTRSWRSRRWDWIG